jgi:hypothetical protein
MLNWLKRSGHATVVAYLALFLALSGGAIAVAGGVKINGSKLKKRSVSGNRLKKHAITGTEVNLDKLGTVPSAKAANTATTANVAGSLATMTGLKSTRITSSAKATTFEAASSAAQPMQLYEDSHFSLYGKCFVVEEEEGKPELDGVLYIATKQNGAIFDAETDELSGSPPEGFLDTNTPEDLRELDEESVGDIRPASIREAEDFTATATDGYTITGPWEVAVKQGTLPTGDGAYGPGDVCIFAGYVLHS